MGEGKEVAAYFDLDGTLLNASSEKTLTGFLAKRRPWRIPHATVAWTLGKKTRHCLFARCVEQRSIEVKVCCDLFSLAHVSCT